MPHPLDKVPRRKARSRKYTGGLQSTLRLMRQYMLDGSRKPYIIELAGKAVADAGITTDRYTDRFAYDVARLEALYDWVRGNVAYVSDGSTANGKLREVVRDVEVTLRARSGDCNDHAVLVGAMILATFDPVEGKPPVEVWLLCVDGVPVHVFVVCLIAGPQRTHKFVVDTAASPGRRFGDLPGAKLVQGTTIPAPSTLRHTITYARVERFFAGHNTIH